MRDLLLGRRPKDFDIATAARPRQVKALFRNCRIIGRRFKLAHLHFDDQILEVSTFRRSPGQDAGQDAEDDLLITADNVFGSAQEDASRRDFTMNGLFYDPEEDCIHDWVGGLADVHARVVRTIGEPLVRLREDPVRILRAVKFASRLGLTIDPATWTAMQEASADLERSAAPRVLEEILRLLRSATALRAFQLLRDCGALAVLIPEVEGFLADRSREGQTCFWRVLEALDGLVRPALGEQAGNEQATLMPETPVLLAALLYDHVENKLVTELGAKLPEGEEPLAQLRESELAQVAESALGPCLKRLNVSRLESARLKRICVLQRRFVVPPRGRSARVTSLLRQPVFPGALQLLRLHCLAERRPWETFDLWEKRYEAWKAEQGEPVAAAQAPRAKPAREDDEAEGGRRTTRRRGSRGRARARPAPPPLPEIHLDPHEVPTYGSVLGDTGSSDKVALEASRSRRARRKKALAETPYSPPPPPDPYATDEPEEPEVFGDW